MPNDYGSCPHCGHPLEIDGRCALDVFEDPIEDFDDDDCEACAQWDE